MIAITYDGGPTLRPTVALRRTASLRSAPRTVGHDILDGPEVYTLRPAAALKGVLVLGFTDETAARDCMEAHRLPAVFTVATDESDLIGFRYIVIDGDLSCDIDEETAAGWVVSVPFQEVG